MPQMTPDECQKMGGHCFESTGVILTSNPPQSEELCKHCGQVRYAVAQGPAYRMGPIREIKVGGNIRLNIDGSGNVTGLHG